MSRRQRYPTERFRKNGSYTHWSYKYGSWGHFVICSCSDHIVANQVTLVSAKSCQITDVTSLGSIIGFFGSGGGSTGMLHPKVQTLVRTIFDRKGNFYVFLSKWYPIHGSTVQMYYIPFQNYSVRCVCWRRLEWLLRWRFCFTILYTSSVKRVPLSSLASRYVCSFTV